MSIRILLLMPLLFGVSVAGWAAPGPCSGKPADRPPECESGDDGGSDGGSGTIYSVTVSGTLSEPPTLWVGTGGVGGSKPVSVARQPLDILDLSFFFDKFGLDQSDEERGAKCFGDGVPVPGVIVILVIREEKGSVVVRHGFTGYADDGTTEVNYVLEMIGGFSGAEWRPVVDTSFVTLNSWEMTINTGGGVKNIACLGSHPDPFLTYIAVIEPPIL